MLLSPLKGPELCSRDTLVETNKRMGLLKWFILATQEPEACHLQTELHPAPVKCVE